MNPLRDWLRENACESIRNDVTPEGLVRLMAQQDGRGIIYADEASIIEVLTGAMYSAKGARANVDVFLDAYDGSPVLVERSTMERPEIPNAFLSITIGLQPGVLERFAKDRDGNDKGLVQRFLFFWPDPFMPSKMRDRPRPDVDLINAWAAKITLLASKFRDAPLSMKLSQEAFEVYADFSDSMEERAFSDLGANISTKAFARKAAGKALRMAALLALLSDPESIVVNENSMQAAVAIMERYFIPQAKRIFDAADRISPQAEALMTAAKSMAAENGPSLAEADLKHKVGGQRQFKGIEGNAAFMKALGELAAAGIIRKVSTEEPQKAGRPSRGKWEIHPELLK